MSTDEQGQTPRHRKSTRFWVLAALAVVVLLPVLLVGGALTVEYFKRAIPYRAAMDDTRREFTAYVLDTYAGVHAVKWEKTHLIWPIGDDASSSYRIYVDEEHYLHDTIYLKSWNEYDHEQRRFEFDRSRLSPESNVDLIFEVGVENALRRLGPSEQHAFDDFRKSPEGSPHAEVRYDVRW